MKLKIYQVDAFAENLFTGNPAAIIPLEKWLSDDLMQKIAIENNLSETAFFVPAGKQFEIRWFTPGGEIDLCGHATLASAYVLYEFLGYKKPALIFNSMSGVLSIEKQDGKLMMDFPSWKPERLETYDSGLQKALGVSEIIGVYKHRDLLVELNREDDVRKASPDFGLIKKLGEKVIITAPADRNQDKIDFVSRFFAPTLGIDEDPVTGSAHSQLIPFWNEKLGKTKMKARQLSARGGTIWCEQGMGRVRMGGDCIFFMKGAISLKKNTA